MTGLGYSGRTVMCLFFKITADLNSRCILMETKFISDLPKIKSSSLPHSRVGAYFKLSGFLFSVVSQITPKINYLFYIFTTLIYFGI